MQLFFSPLPIVNWLLFAMTTLSLAVLVMRAEVRPVITAKGLAISGGFSEEVPDRVSWGRQIHVMRYT